VTRGGPAQAAADGPAQVAAGARVVVATGNAGKLREIRAVLEDLGLRLVGLGELPPLALPEEGDDYVANAVAKAQAAAAATGWPALGDDSGLEVEALGGAPGPHSARFGGPGLDDAGRVALLLARLEGRRAEGRRARFVCAAALAFPEGEVATALGSVGGHIASSPRGLAGFGYDPVFVVDAQGRTLAELPADEKNRVSHRGQAFRALRDELRARIPRAR
jgi:XTP/dITP diphosphohydrolase